MRAVPGEDVGMAFLYLAAAIVLALAGWLFGSITARVAGILLAIGGLLGMIRGGAEAGGMGVAVTGFGVFVLGFILWLVGHWIYAYKHHYWRSALARRLFNQTPLRSVNPARGWGYPVVWIDRRDDS
jgi:hypothetical protein